MNKKYCIGCGIELQCEDENKDGFIKKEVFDKAVMCKRCFRLKNYGEYKVTNKTDEYYKNIIKNIFSMKELVIHIIDVFNMGNIDYIYDKIDSSSILVISKIDILPKSVNEERLIEYFKSKYPKYKEIITISSNKNYHMDELLMLINKYKVSNKVYIIGNSNAGKSTFINKVIKNYTNDNNFIVTSYMPSTTLELISIKINEDLTLIDTPGIINNGDISNSVEEDIVKLINIKQEIKPRIYQIKDNTSLILDKIGRIDVLNNTNISIYISNDIDINKGNYENNTKYRDLNNTNIMVLENEDLVIEGLCFIKVTKPTEFNIYMPKNVNIYKRDKFIG